MIRSRVSAPRTTRASAVDGGVARLTVDARFVLAGIYLPQVSYRSGGPMPRTDAIRLYSFAPGYGLPTTGPLTLKLMMALRMAGIPYQLEPGDLKKSPKRKIPWIETGTTVMADTALILRWLAET